MASSTACNRVLGVVFDLDGTVVSQELDFEAIRVEIGLPSGTPLLEALARMPLSERQRAGVILDEHERIAAAKARLLPGVIEFMGRLERRGIPRALLSRNSRRSVATILERFGLRFDPVMAREDAPHKPDPAGLTRICHAWMLQPSEVLIVGDFLYDLQAGKAAGTRTALVTHGRDWPFAHLADVTFSSFCELPELLLNWLELPAGI
jgi:HAD superfamily hydrolase (TIGR01549 family)